MLVKLSLRLHVKETDASAERGTLVEMSNNQLKIISYFRLFSLKQFLCATSDGYKKLHSLRSPEPIGLQTKPNLLRHGFAWVHLVSGRKNDGGLEMETSDWPFKRRRPNA